MPFSPGRNVGRVSIRVVPDTTRFNEDLRKELRSLTENEDFGVRIDKAHVDKAKVRESIRRQLAEFNDLDFDAKIQAVVDSVKLRRGKVRASIQAQFDSLNDVKVWIRPQISKEDERRFLHRVEEIRKRAERNKINLGVNAQTLAAAQQIRYTARDRIVNLIVRVSKTSIASALATFAALSGARLSWKWMDTLLDKVKNLDKLLPSIINWTSGITALIAAIGGSISGLSGIGAGLFQITPALLVVPGLIMNAVGSLTVLFVALKHAGTELAVLGDNMNELGQIINTQFWTRARQPIIDLVQNLMPQLRSSFTELAAGVGDFTAALARAFGEEFANGRLASIFTGIAEGWRILGTGAAGFAGAIVNLTEIAARYTPRLARWFVRQANTFDAFLTSIATDGRLERWMEGAIDSMYALWDATRGFAGVLAGIWRAADNAGSGGLRGFADLMLEWRNVVNSAKFQTGLEAIFRGSAVAMDAFGDAIISLGNLVANMPKQFETFVGSVGGFLGGVFDAAFKALDNANFRVGLDGFSQGLQVALAGIKPALDPIARTFGNFLGLLGDLAGNLLPTAAGVLADLMPALDGLIRAVQPVLAPLGEAVLQVSGTLGPAIADFVSAASPLFQQVIGELADALVQLAPAIAALVDVLSDVVQSLGQWAENNKGFFEGIEDALTPDNLEWISEVKDAVGDFVRSENGFVLKWDVNANDSLMQQQALAWGNSLAAKFREVMAQKGPEAAQAFLDGLNSADLPSALRDDLESRFGEDFRGLMESKGSGAGGGFSRGLAQGIDLGMPNIETALSSSGGSAIQSFGQGFDAGKPQALAGVSTIGADIDNLMTTITMFARGLAMAVSFANGIAGGKGNVDAAVLSLVATIPALIPPSLLLGPALAIMNGFTAGIILGRIPALLQVLAIGPMMRAMLPRTTLFATGMSLMGGLSSGMAFGRIFVILQAISLGPAIRNAVPTNILFGAGTQIAYGLAAGINSGSGAAVSAARSMAARVLSATRAQLQINSPSKRMENEAGRWIPAGLARGIDKNAYLVERSARAMSNFDLSGGGDGGNGVGVLGNTYVEVNQSLLPGETPKEQRDNLVRELSLIH